MVKRDESSELSGETPPSSRGVGGAASLSSRKSIGDLAGTNLKQDFDSDQTFLPDITTPLRGGYIKHLDAAYVGGAPVAAFTYLLSVPKNGHSFWGAGQLRDKKSMSSHLSAVRSRINSSSWVTFQGGTESAPNAKSLGKVEFLQKLTSDIKVFGLESLFSPTAPVDRKPRLLTENLHDFTLQSVVDDHAYRLQQANKTARGYDIFESSDFSLSHALVQSYLSDKLYSDIQTAYTDISEFAYLPGQVLLMLALENTNNLITYDIDAATKSFEGLQLISYPGENVGDLVKDCLKFLRIMDGGYCLPYNVQSTLLYKMNATNSANFNFQISVLLRSVLEMEDSVGVHKPPTLIKQHSKYKEHNVWALCEKVATTYRQEVGHNRWIVERLPAPEGNLGSTGTQENPNGKFCWDCGSFFHLCNSPDCPMHGTSSQGAHRFKSSRSGGGGQQDRNNNNSDKSSSDKDQRRSMAPWRLIHPKDPNKCITVDGREYKFCSKCIYRQTNQVGFYTTGPKMHSTSEHKEGSSSPAPAPAPTPAASDAASQGSEGNLGAALLPSSAAELDSSDPNGMYAGAFTAEALGFHSEVLAGDTLEVERQESKDDVEKQMAAWDDVDIAEVDDLMKEFSGWDLSGSGFLAVHSRATNSPLEASSGAFVRVLNPVSVSSGKKHNLYGQIVSTPKRGGMYFKLAVYDRGLQCFKEVRRCRDKFVVVGIPTQLPPLLDSWQATESSGPLLAVGIGPNLSDGVHFEYLFESRECPLTTESQYSLLALTRQHLVTYPPTISREEVPAGYLDEETEASSLPVDFDRTDIASDDSSLSEITSKVNSLAVYPLSTTDSDDELFFFDSLTTFPADVDIFHDAVSPEALEESQPEALEESQPQVHYFQDEVYPVLLLLRTLLSTGVLTICRLVWFASALFWDSIDGLLLGWPSESSPVIAQRVSHRGRSSLLRYPRVWMLLSCLQLTHNAPRTFGCVAPLDSHIVLPIKDTWTRQNTLALVLDPDPLFLLHYQQVRGTQCLSSLFKSSTEQEESLPLLTLPLEPYLDPVSEFFFDSFDSLPTSSLFFDGDTYFDANGHILPAPSLWDFDLSTLHSFWSVDCRQFESDLSPAAAPSPLAYNAGLLGSIDLLPTSLGDSFPIIFDTGASLAISPCESDFVPGSIIKLQNRYLGGLANGLPITGIGTVRWVFKTGGDKDLILMTRCYHVPHAKARLLTPQKIFSKKLGVNGRYVLEEDSSVLQIDGLPDLVVNYNTESSLPVSMARNFTSTPEANLGILDAENANLTHAQKDFLRWHYRFGHLSMQKLKHLLCCLPFSKIAKFGPLAKSTPCRCEICQYAKQTRVTAKGKITSTDDRVDGHLKSNILRPGEKVSVDHFESRLKGRTFTSFGGSTADSYGGGCVFVDHMSGYLHPELQVGFSASETIRAKQNFEQLASSHGVPIQSYLADNGAFKAHAFERHIRESNQKIQFCGVNAHHQNGIAERSIRTVSEKARAMLLHAALHWKDGVSSSLWPMAVKYAAYQYNHLPNSEGHAPADLFTGSVFPRHKLLQMHTWGCPVYVLDPKLQQGKKLPRWNPRARRGMFVGFSSVHSSDVPLILNLQTGHISPQFHVVFDDDFSTVSSLSSDDDVPDFWSKLSLNPLEELSPSIVTRIPLDPHSNIEIEDIWLPPDELEEKRRHDTIANGIRQVHFDPSSTAQPSLAPSRAPTPAPAPPPASSAPTSTSAPPTVPPTVPSSAPASAPSVRRSSRAAAPRQQFNISTVTGKSYTSVANFGCEFSYEYNFLGEPAPVTECNLATNDPTIAHTLAQSSSITDQTIVDDVLLHQADISVDLPTGESNGIDPRAYAAKHKTKLNPDMPSFDMASRSSDREQWLEAMKKELRTLLQQQTWTELDRNTVLSSGTKARILPGTWAFKLKRRPDGRALKFKARYCVRGDLQTAGVDYFETYAPVVQWSTVRLILTHTLINGWTTKQVDYTNAFAQADLAEDVYIERPRGFPRKDGRDTVLKLNKSLYELKQAPKSFYDKLRAGLEQRGFTRSEIDHCLFLKKDMMVVVYVDDTIICGPDSAEIEKLIVDLGVSDDEHREVFELRDEGNVGDFLGIRIEKRGDTYHLTQKGLTEKVIKAAYMDDCNVKLTPVLEEALGKDINGDPFTEDWKYSEIVGMLLYLANNSRPDIAFAVHQCARFTHDPKQSHAEAVKRVLRYLQGTKDKGISLRPDGTKGVDCFVDADFAGLWKAEDAQDPVSVKSRTGYLITFLGCPLSWCSKLQTQIALSTMEAEYIALSTALREVIGVREILKEIQQLVLKPSKSPNKYTFFSKSFGKDHLKPTIVHEDNNACLQFAMMPKMNPRTKHIAIPYHFFRQYVVKNEILVQAIGTDDQLADQFTKGLGRIKFERARKKLMGW